MTVTLRLTRAQQMALIDVVMSYIRNNREQPQTFFDASSGTETTSGELLRIVSDVGNLERSTNQVPA